MQRNKRLFKALRQGLLVVLALSSTCALGELWISKEPPSGKTAATASPADKTLYIRQGDFSAGTPDGSAPTGVERTAFIIDPNDEVIPVQLEGDSLHFRAPLKGHHWVFLQQQTLRGETLEVELTKYRFYNRQGDVQQSLLKEIRGRTNDSKYGRPPVAELPFEIVLQKPDQAHHISCCLYSGDRVRAKVYYRQAPLPEVSIATLSDSGWSARFRTDETGLVAFEIPRYRYSDSGRRRRDKQYLLLTADYQVDSAGSFQGAPYRQVHYHMSRPIDFRPSPLEWAAKLPAFLLLAAVMLVTGFAIFLYRLKVRRRRLACAE